MIKESYEVELEPPWDEESAWSAASLLRDGGPQGKARFFKVDIWHSVHMGQGKDLVASGFCLLQKLMPGTNVDVRFEGISQLYLAWCAEWHKTKYINKITKDLVGGAGKRDEPHGAWNKASLTTTLLEFMEFFCEQHAEDCQPDQRLRFVVPCIASEIFSHTCHVLFLWPCCPSPSSVAC